MRVAVAMSGGVDSSLAAALLKEAGHEVVGLTLKLWPCAADEADFRPDACCSPEHVLDAAAVAARLGMPHHVLDVAREFEAEIVAPFVAEYLAGRTPNPCLVCNARIKFGWLLDRARRLGCEALATGHYARLTPGAGGGGSGPAGPVRLGVARDRERDQSYFLAALAAEKLERIIFPLAELTKAEVRARAAALGLRTAAKKASQEICFIPGDDYVAFLRGRRPEAFRSGPIVDLAGRELGTHAGLAAYTVGQRRGLGIALGYPAYVVRLEPEANRLVVGPEEALYARALVARELHWLAGGAPPAEFRAAAKIRYRTPAAACTVRLAEASGEVRVAFDEPQRAVTPGQAVVFYEGELVLGMAWIEREFDQPAGAEKS